MGGKQWMNRVHRWEAAGCCACPSFCPWGGSAPGAG